VEFKATRTFFDQAEKFGLRCACEDCSQFDARTETCIHGYPNDVHRLAYLRSSPPVIVPCKDFELAL